MVHITRPPVISAEYSLERIVVRLGDDIARLHKQLSALAGEEDSPLRATTTAVYEEMLAKRQALLMQVEAELEAHSTSYEAIAL